MRNAFLMLFHSNRPAALRYVVENLDNIHKFGTGMQQLVLELIKVVRAGAARRGA